jgi:hypothetical protein
VIFFIFFRKVILRKGTSLKRRSNWNLDTPSATMATQDTCEFSKMLMNMSPDPDTPSQLHSDIIRTSVLILDYMKIDGQDKGLTWCLFRRKALELGHTHKLAALCAVTDVELDRAGPCELKRHVVTAREEHRAHYNTQVPEVQVCAYGQCSAMLVASCVLCAVGVESEEDSKGVKKLLFCAGCGTVYCDREFQSRDMVHFETNGCKARAANRADEATTEEERGDAEEGVRDEPGASGDVPVRGATHGVCGAGAGAAVRAGEFCDTEMLKCDGRYDDMTVRRAGGDAPRESVGEGAGERVVLSHASLRGL